MATVCNTFVLFMYMGLMWTSYFADADKFILVSVDDGIYFYPGDGSTINSTTPPPNLINVGVPDLTVTNMDVNCADGIVYFLDLQTQCIYRLKISTNLVTTVHCGLSRSIYSSIAYDWISGNMYWTDGFFNWIGVQPVDTLDKSMYRIIVQDDIEKPRSLAVDPIAGYIFWFDIHKSGFRIERASLDGTNRIPILTNSLLNVQDIEVDILSMRLYWTDAYRYTIETANYDGSDRRIFHIKVLIYFKSLSIDINYVCTTAYTLSQWRCIHKTTGVIDFARSNEFSSTELPNIITVFKADLKPFMTDDCPMMACEHFCVHPPSISKCICKEGYTLDIDGIHCNANHQLYAKGVFICNDTKICMYDFRLMTIHVEPLLCLPTDVQGCRHLAADTDNDIIYYADSVSNTINGYHLGTDIVGSVTSAVSVSGLAFDWSDMNLYWSESVSGGIKAISLTTNAVRNVDDTSLPPSHLTIDPHSRTLFWVEGTDGSTMRILSKPLNGSIPAEVLKQRSPASIKSLFYDVTSDSLFHVDSNLLHVTSRTGEVSFTYGFEMDDVTQMVVYKRYAVWSFGNNQNLKSIPLQYNVQKITSLPMKFGGLTGIAVYDPALQQTSKGPCYYLNGGCEHICLSGVSGTFTCECSYGFYLQPDGKSCGSVHQVDDFILAPDFANGRIYQIAMADANINALDIGVVQSPLSIVYDPNTTFIYWTDITDGHVMRSTLDGTNFMDVFTSIGAESTPILLVMDFSTGNLYIAVAKDDFDFGSIVILQPTTGLSRTLVDNLQSISGLVIYPSKGVMYYTDRNGTAYFIVKSSMDGTNPREVIILDRTDETTALTIDYKTDLLYWSGNHGVSYSGLNGENATVLISDVANIIAIEIVGHHLFYTSEYIHHIVKYDLETGLEVSFMSDNAILGLLFNIFIHPGEVQEDTSVCSTNNGGCSTFCIPREVPSLSPCTCQNGVNLEPEDPFQCAGGILCQGDVLHGQLINTCGRLTYEDCTFECNTGYIRTVPNNTVTCQNDGQWNQNLLIICENKCSSNITNGRLWPTCTRSINESCEYDCNVGYTKGFESVTCTEDNQWSNAAGEICVIDGNQLITQQEQPHIPDTSIALIGVAGFAGLVLGAIVVIVIICLLLKKRGKKQKDSRQSTPEQPQPSNEVASSSHRAFNLTYGMSEFVSNSPLPLKELPENEELVFPKSYYWNTLQDVNEDIHGEFCSDLDFGPGSSRAYPTVRPPYSTLIQHTSKDFRMRRISSDVVMHSPKEKTKLRRAASDESMQNSPKQERQVSPSSISIQSVRADPQMRRISSDTILASENEKPKIHHASSSVSIHKPNDTKTVKRISSALPMQISKGERASPRVSQDKMRRNSSVASMQTLHEEPSIRRTTSAVFSQMPSVDHKRRRSSVVSTVSSLGDQLYTRRSSIVSTSGDQENNRRSSVISINTPIKEHPQRRRASIAVIPTQFYDKSNKRRLSDTSMQTALGDIPNRRRSSVTSLHTPRGEFPSKRRSSVISVQSASENQNNDTRLSSAESLPDEPITPRRASIAPVETNEVEEDDTFYIT